MWKKYLNTLKEEQPVIHNITNYVTVNDCANILLACGASPIMADAKEEVEEITSICKGLNLNIGTPHVCDIEAMLLAGKKANALKHPILLDPVGIGASTLRTNTVMKLIEELELQVIRGNISEIKAIALGTATVNGVDASSEDSITKDNLSKVLPFIKELAKKTGAIIVVSGAIDIVSDSNKSYVLYNGHAMMSSVTGTGCMLSAIITAYLAANPKEALEATAAAVLAMGICGEVAYERITELDGNSSYRNYIIDAMYRLDGDELESRAKYEVY